MNGVSLIALVFEPGNFIALVTAGLAFMAVLTLISSVLERQDRKKRVDFIVNERERLRAQHLDALKKQKASSGMGLRHKPKGIIPQLVEALNLRRVFDAENIRKQLRQAGYRLEKHLIMFLGARLISPFALGLLAYLYSPIILGADAPANKVLAVTLGGFLLGNYLPSLWLKNTIQKRQDSILQAWPDALDLLLICVESGQSVEQALNRVSMEISSQSRPLAEEMQLTMAELSYLNDRRKALENLAARTNLPAVRSVVTAMIQSERYGTPLAQSLRVLATQSREERKQQLEKKAASLPPKLTVPLIAFFMPVIFVVLLAPPYINWKTGG